MISFLVASITLSGIGRPLPRLTREVTPDGSQFKTKAVSLEDSTWQKVAPSCPTLLNQYGQPTGLAILIDKAGILLTHRVNLTEGAIQARFPLSKAYDLKVIGSDPATQLIALQILGWKGGSPAIAVVDEDLTIGEVVLAATSQGALRGQLVALDRPGMMAPSNRYIPLMEVRLEQSGFKVGGAMVFGKNGHLAGILGATLASPQDISNMRNAGIGGGNTASPQTASKAQSSLQAFGPQGVTVGYALPPSLLRRVVDGFRTPSRAVRYPAIGVQYSDAKTGSGALIQQVSPGSSAERAGLLAGDVVRAVDGKSIKGAVELGATLLGKSIGDTIKLELIREGATLTISVQIEAQALAM